MKKCSRCKEEKSLTEFCKDRHEKDGLSSRCRECRVELNRIWRNNNRDKDYLYKKTYIQKNPEKRSIYDSNFERKTRIRAYEYKGGKCEDCGAIPFESSHRFEFHHIDPSTKGSHWGRIKRRSWEIQKEELDKCVLLCQPCHIKRHKDFNNGLRETL